jgi:conjugative relaxase-like TrwC/TraI family protein
MLSMSMLSSPSQAVSYYEKDDYYAANGGDPDSQGQWFGKTAEDLGLEGAVDREQFRKLLEGKLPDGQQLGVTRNGELQHVPGWDMTFSAPKSVSLMYEIGGDERVLEAHNLAVREALGWMEETAAGTRRFSDGRAVPEHTGNLAAALFTHDTSRNQDPQLHTHSVMMNLTKNADGAYRSMYSKPFFEAKMAGGAIYRAALASELSRIGYEIEKTASDGQFEIEGITPEILQHFSTRDAEVKKLMAERGLSSYEDAKKAALLTRSSKETLDRGELLQNWMERSEAIGFDPKAHIPGTVREAKPREAPSPQHAFNAAIDRLKEREAAFTHTDLVRTVLAEGMGTMRVANAERVIADNAESKGGTLYAASIDGRKAWTTTSASHQERTVQNNIAGGRNTVRPVMSSRALRRAMDKTTLTSEQREAVSMIMSSRDRFTAVLGRPGTGKTFMLDFTREQLNKKGYELVGMAPNAEAARQLSESAGVRSTTLASQLIAAGKEFHKRQTTMTPQQRLVAAKANKEVWVLDESSQVDNQSFSRLAKLATALGARVVFVGDSDQLAAIGAGKPFARALETGLKHVELTDIRRQKDLEQRSAVQQGIAGDVTAALDTLQHRTTTIQSEHDRLDAIVDAWSTSNNRSDTLVLTARNATKQALNERMRDVLRGEGALTNEQTTDSLVSTSRSRADMKVAGTYQAGDVVRFNRDARSIDVKNGQYWNVISRDPKTNTVILERDGHRIEWNPMRVGNGMRGGAELFKPATSTVANGEKLTWTRNNKALGLTNGMRITVDERQGDRMVVTTEDGRKISLDLNNQEHRHWDHGYATTIYKSQGKTAKDVLVNLPSSDRTLLSQKAFLVAISRQTDNIQLYTDNRDQVEKNVLGNLGEKTSALDSRQERSALDLAASVTAAMDRSDSRHAGRFPPSKPIPERDRPQPQR